MKVDGILYWVVTKGAGSGVGRCIGNKVDSGVGDEIGKIVEL